MDLLILLGAMLAKLALLALDARRARAEAEAFTSAARILAGLHQGDATARRIEADLGGVTVEAEALTVGAGKHARREVRLVAHGVPEGIALRRQTAFGARPAHDVKTGDDLFDAAVIVEGEELAARAALDHPTRAAVLNLLQMHPAELSGGRVELTIPARVTDAILVTRFLRAAADVVAGMQDASRDARRSLEGLAVHDPLPGVRRAAFRDLARRFPGAADRLAARAMTDRDPIVRALAAARMGAEGVPTLRALLSLTPNGDALVIASDALAVAGDSGAERGLIALLEHVESRVRIAAARALGAVGGRSAVEPLLDLTKGVLFDGDVRRAARAAVAEIQSRLGDPEAGRLSLADGQPARGAVTVLDAGRGALSAAKLDDE